MRALARTVAALAIAIVPAACDDPAPVEVEAPLPSELQPLVDAGFDLGEVEDIGTHYVVMGDIAIRKDWKPSYREPGPFDPSGLTPEQRLRKECNWLVDLFMNCGPVSQGHVGSVRVVMASSLEQVIKDATISAVNAWNAIPGNKIRFTIASSWTGQDNEIFVYHTGANAEICGRAEYPDNGDTGSWIQIPWPAAQGCSGTWINTMAHELGHNIGYMHADKYEGHQIAKTPLPGYDPSSVMNSATHSWLGFTPGDATAARIVYPDGFPQWASVTNDGGKPRISWNRAEASSFRVVRFERPPCEGTRDRRDCPEPTYTQLGTTTATSFLDTGRNYTGQSTECMIHYIIHPTYADDGVARQAEARNAPVC